MKNPQFPRAKTNGARVLAGLLLGHSAITDLGRFAGLEPKQVRTAIDGLRDRGVAIDSRGDSHFALAARRAA